MALDARRTPALRRYRADGSIVDRSLSGLDVSAQLLVFLGSTIAQGIGIQAFASSHCAQLERFVSRLF